MGHGGICNPRGRRYNARLDFTQWTDRVMPKLKSHKGLLKRVKITGRGKVKWHRAFAGHLMSHKTANKKQDLRQTRCAKSGDIKRLKRMLHQPLTASDTADE